MRKFLDEVEREEVDAVVQDTKVNYQKRGLLRSVGDFSIPVLDAIERWLFSFPSGMTKDAFNRQLKNIDKDEQVALAQLKAAHGFRVIKKTKTEKQSYLERVAQNPHMSKSFMQNISEDNLFYSIAGERKKCERYVLDALRDLSQFGSVYVLPTDELFAMLRTTSDRGGSDELLERAKKCDFLILENLDQPIGIVSRAAEWALTSLVNLRIKQKKPILCRHNECHLLSYIYEKCPVYYLG